MLTGKKLGAAIDEAIRLKGVTKAALARHFDIKPPSISDWVKRGTIDKEKLEELFAYFSDVVGPEHWGVTSDFFARRYEARQEPPTYLVRPLVAQINEIAEQINDDGLRELIGFARCLAGSYALAKQTRKSSA